MAKKSEYTIGWTEFGSSGELTPERSELVEAAVKAAGNAYAPYSRFSVGAALRLENGDIITGVNVENAAFPSGICAERNAVAASASARPGIKPVAIAIAAFDANGITHEPVSPCGNCRQVIAEEEYRYKNRLEIILHGRNRTVVIEGMDNLLPMKFNNESINRGSP